ncbi:hypothetical protein DEO72_LG1g1444 [Vigna unguiculata]|uniref:BZIP domain-containing protein n=1 Tax=Vigna unguiculata TaxID=3917 RepID=A0A4D6KIT4_VIGUN|nr:hypothetical protein DEO72_LG1g1444 [Vigna unguiculata]
MDAQKKKRIMSNRLSSRRSWQKKQCYKINLETQSKSLEDQISGLKPELGCYQNHKQLLEQEQLKLRQRVEIIQKKIMLKNAEIEMNKSEVNKLRECSVMQQGLLQAPFLSWNIDPLQHWYNDPNSYQASSTRISESVSVKIKRKKETDCVFRFSIRHGFQNPFWGCRATYSHPIMPHFSSTLLTKTAKLDMDAQKKKRIMSNRLSSRRSWQKKQCYKINLETQSKSLEDQISGLKPELGCYQNHKQLLEQEQLKLRQRVEIIQKKIMLKNAEIEMNKSEVNKLRECSVMQQGLLQAPFLSWNIDPLQHWYNDPNSYQGNGVGTSYIPAEPSHMWIHDNVPNMHGMNMNMPNNYIGSMINDISRTFPNSDLN